MNSSVKDISSKDCGIRTAGNKAFRVPAFPLLSTFKLPQRDYERWRSSGAAAMPMRRSSSW